MQVSKTSTVFYDSKYDILKLILSVMVVAIHTGIYPLILYPWLRIAVPLFFVISSYFLFNKLQTVEEQDQWKVVKKYAIRNIRLYIFWSVALSPLTLYLRRDSYFPESFWDGLCAFIWDLLTGSGFGASWYIPASVIGTLIIWWLCKKIKLLSAGLISLGAFCFVTLLSSYISVLQNYPSAIQCVQIYSRFLGNPVLSFPASLCWIFIGKCFSENRIKTFSWLKSLFSLLISSIALYLEWRYVQQMDGSFNNDSYFLLLPVCISFFICFLKIGSISYHYATNMRQISTVIYVTHVTLIVPIGFIYREILHIYSKHLVFFTVLCCCIFIYLIIKTVLHRYKKHKIANLLKYAF